MHIRRPVIITAAALALVAGGTAAGAAIAAGPVDGAGVIHSCMSPATLNGTHLVELQDVGTSCPQGWTAVTWNQTGPPGATGPTGPQGPIGLTGAVGPAGPAGASAGIVTDAGVITINATASTCTLNNVVGPDAATISTSGIGSLFHPPGTSTCVIQGFPRTIVPGTVTPLLSIGSDQTAPTPPIVLSDFNYHQFFVGCPATTPVCVYAWQVVEASA
jgi:hypothetical protein